MAGLTAEQTRIAMRAVEARGDLAALDELYAELVGYSITEDDPTLDAEDVYTVIRCYLGEWIDNDDWRADCEYKHATWELDRLMPKAPYYFEAN